MNEDQSTCDRDRLDTTIGDPGDDEDDGMMASRRTAALHARLAALGPGTRFGPYRIERFLGEGGFSLVFQAVEEPLERPVALKVLGGRITCDAAFRQRFLRESRAAARVADRHVVTIHAAGEHDGLLYMAFEFMRGGDLESRVRQTGPLPTDLAMRLAAQCLQGLHALHQSGLVHRDLKPHNVFLDEYGNAKIGDFGMAREASGDDRFTATGAVIGTPTYMSPEQAMGREAIDIRSDLFSLGGTLYTALTGKRPFTGDSPFAVTYQVISGPAPVPSKARRGLGPAVDAFLAHLMAKDPANRPVTPLAALEDLRRRGLVTTDDHDAALATTTVIVPRPRRRWHLALAAAVAVVAIAVTAKSWRQPADPERGPELAASTANADTTPLPTVSPVTDPSTNPEEAADDDHAVAAAATPATAVPTIARGDTTPTLDAPHGTGLPSKRAEAHAIETGPTGTSESKPVTAETSTSASATLIPSPTTAVAEEPVSLPSNDTPEAPAVSTDNQLAPATDVAADQSPPATDAPVDRTDPPPVTPDAGGDATPSEHAIATSVDTAPATPDQTAPAATDSSLRIGRDDFGPWRELQVGSARQRFRLCPAGTFTMGSPSHEPGHSRSERQRDITLSEPVWLADTEVTRRLWHQVMGREPPSGDRRQALDEPATRVNWHECQRFLRRLRILAPALAVRLPTEAEWEYACRAGSMAAYTFGHQAAELVDFGNFADRSSPVEWRTAHLDDGHGAGPAPVASYRPNAWGLYDMHGNVWEWCADAYLAVPSTIGAVDPWLREGDTRVRRGGGWKDPVVDCRSARRIGSGPDTRRDDVGLRLAVESWPEE